MIMAKKDPIELMNNDGAAGQNNSRKKPEAPITVVLRNFMMEEGKALELTSRMNLAAIKAAQVTYIFSTQLRCPVTGEIGSPFLVESMEQIERLLISKDGLGRQDQIAALQAGGRLPDSYYQDGKKANYMEVQE